MFKQLCAVMMACAILSGCAGKSGSELYGEDGGWKDDVNIMDLKTTGLTDKLKATGYDVVYFKLDSSELNAEARANLAKQAVWLKDNPKALIVVEGNCDERGTTEYNLALGEHRANAARNYLMSNGIEAKRIRTISYGKDKPAALGSTEEAWAKNRNAASVAY
ncbi:MAG: peptidoglycan-associated lipoprotein Pal [Alphaproteobacteria bacterium]|nr:peptidoglycan-associated lipoprotein Pal [Alphaproteobacteria bacterium]